MGRNAPLTSKRCILYIYSTNMYTEYFKHALYSPVFFSLQNAVFHNSNLFGSCIIHILYTECAKIKKKKFRQQRVNPCISQYDLHRRLRLQFLVLMMMGAVTSETCRVTAVK